MEPMIYKPGAYKTPGVYKGVGGIYNGRGVYNDGLQEFVEIGGKKYPVVKIGFQKWLGIDLNFIFDGLIVGASGDSYTEPRANYYNNDELNYGSYGLLYNWIAAKYLNDNKLTLLNGFRVPTKSDYDILISFVQNNASLLKTKYGWDNSGNGTNKTKFSSFPLGHHYSNNYAEFGHSANYICLDFFYGSNPHGNYYNKYLTSDSNVIRQGEPGIMHQMSLRLIHDV